MTSEEVRGIVRAELRRMLAGAGDAIPAPVVEGRPGLGEVLAAWEVLAGAGDGMTAKEAVAAGDRMPNAWSALWLALRGMGVTGRDRGPRALGMALRGMRGRVAGGRRMVRSVTRTGLARWRVEVGGG